MKYLSVLLLIAILFMPASKKTHAQTVQILANNTLNGAINGVVLGGAGMLMADKKVNAPFTKNMDDLYALQVGLSLGTLYGVGVGAYDVVTSGGREMLVSGFFNDATNSAAIVLMDTFYGTASGTLIGASVTLLSSNPNFDDVKFGMGLGTFIGFGFGVFDSFFLAQRSTEQAPVAMNFSPQTTASGFASIQFNNATSIGLINPTLVQVLDISETSVHGSYASSVELLNFRVNF